MTEGIMDRLIKKGVNILNPKSVYISDDVNPDRISDGVTIFPGCRIYGEETLIMKHARIGEEEPVTLNNTLIGKNCSLNGGTFTDTVFAGDSQFGPGAHVRKGTILEEQAGAAHTVGLKQTILFPFVTLGSLINFCDCMMAGGTSRKNHSEVGSSFIHFNYTPNQDKATPSMMGDVHQGVMLRSKPIFLGGQGGVVGPVRINYGCITAAGSIIRKNELNEDRILLGGSLREMSVPRQPFVYKNITHVFNNNVDYISNLIALRYWYEKVRSLFAYDYFSEELIKGMQRILTVCINERIKRFEGFIENLKISKEILLSKHKASKLVLSHKQAIEKFNQVKDAFLKMLELKESDRDGELFTEMIIKKLDKKNYIKTIQSLEEKESQKGSQWLLNLENSMIKNNLI